MKLFNSIRKVALVVIAIGSIICCQESGNAPAIIQEGAVQLQEDRLGVIADLSLAYENAILEALAERDRFSHATGTSFNIAERISVLCEQKYADYKSHNPVIDTRSETEFEADPGKVQKGLDQLQDLWLSMPVLQQMDETKVNEEDIISDVRKVADNPVTTVLSDRSLKEVERQLIAENIIFRKNIAVTTIKYGQEIRDAVSTRSIAKILEAVRCVLVSVNALVSCVSGSNVCGGNVDEAIGCWSDL
jgi:hypothetical protein